VRPRSSYQPVLALIAVVLAGYAVAALGRVSSAAEPVDLSRLETLLQPGVTFAPLRIESETIGPVNAELPGHPLSRVNAYLHEREAVSAPFLFEYVEAVTGTWQLSKGNGPLDWANVSVSIYRYRDGTQAATVAQAVTDGVKAELTSLQPFASVTDEEGIEYQLGHVDFSAPARDGSTAYRFAVEFVSSLGSSYGMGALLTSGDAVVIIEALGPLAPNVLDPAVQRLTEVFDSDNSGMKGS